jgi:biotin synthase
LSYLTSKIFIPKAFAAKEALMITRNTVPTCSKWFNLANDVLNGYQLNQEDALEILASTDAELMELLAAANRLRYHYFRNTVQLYFLVNAKSGLCPEDCNYCSQSKISDAPVAKYRLMSDEQLLDGAKAAAERKSKTYCIVLSGRGPNEREIQAIENIVPKIKDQFGLKICACLGLLNEGQAKRLKACGVDRVNHNLNTSEEHYEKICTTHTYADRIETLNHIRDAGLEICSGGIIGMGEKHSDIVSMAIELRTLNAESIPLNFLYAIDGTPLEGVNNLTTRDCLRALAMFRFVNPGAELRIAGGREKHLRSLQPLGLMVANSIFVGDYLTTKGQLPEEDYRMIADLGYEITGHVQLESDGHHHAEHAHDDEHACGGHGCGGNGCGNGSCQTPVQETIPVANTQSCGSGCGGNKSCG